MAKPKREKIRTEFRKNRTTRRRKTDLTRHYHTDISQEDEPLQKESVSGKGSLTRKRTVVGNLAADDETGLAVHPAVDLSVCKVGRVSAVRGLINTVQTDDGRCYQCVTRRLLKTLATDQRHVVVVGDRVLFRPQGQTEGIIERIEPRQGILSRSSRGRKHVIVANIDQVLIITSAAQPTLKPHLIDRLLVSAEKGGMEPFICINKIDLIVAADIQPLIGVYGQMGYDVIVTSVTTGMNIDRLRRLLADRQSVVAGQSGVGKSSLLNAVDSRLELRVAEVSRDTEKGKHTTTTAQLIRLRGGGYVVDTPGIRTFELWDVDRNEVANFFRDLRPYAHACRFPDCTHTHERECAVKESVADGRLDARRYESYCQLLNGE